MANTHLILRLFIFSVLFFTSYSASANTITPSFNGKSTTRHKVLLISIDGFGKNVLDVALAQNKAKTIKSLMDNGLSSETARTVYPAKTIAAHTSMLTGLSPKIHGAFDNFPMFSGTYTSFPTVLDLLKSRGRTVGAVVGKVKLQTVLSNNDLEEIPFLYYPSQLVYLQRGLRVLQLADPWGPKYKTPGRKGHVVAMQVKDETLSLLDLHGQPDFLFLHFSDVDYQGHERERPTQGWTNPDQLKAVERIDAAIGEILKRIDNETIVIITADHGGHGNNHGTMRLTKKLSRKMRSMPISIPDLPSDILPKLYAGQFTPNSQEQMDGLLAIGATFDESDMQIPWIISGADIKNKFTLNPEITVYDTAPTVAYIMLGQVPQNWNSRTGKNILIKK